MNDIKRILKSYFGYDDFCQVKERNGEHIRGQ